MNINERYDEVGEKLLAVVKSYQGDGLTGLVPIIHALHDMYFGTIMPLLGMFGLSDSLVSSLDKVLQEVDNTICDVITKDDKDEC